MNKTFFKSQFVKVIILLLLPFIVLSPYIISNINKTIKYYDMQNITYVDVSDEDEYIVKYDIIYNSLYNIYVLKNQPDTVNIEKNKDVAIKDNTPRVYKISKRGYEFIKSHEKCKLAAYHIPGEKHNTIGWGHYLQKPSEKNIKKISQKRADELFVQDIAWVDKAVTNMLNEVNASYKWPQGIVDGLGSLVYNCGERGVRTTEFYRRLQNCRFHNGEINASDIAYTLVVVKKTRCTKPGHYKRRLGEYKMMRENFS